MEGNIVYTLNSLDKKVAITVFSYLLQFWIIFSYHKLYLNRKKLIFEINFNR